MTSPGASSSARGIMFMLAAVLLFSVMDALGKAISHETNTVMAIWARYLGQSVAVFLIVVPKMPTVLKTGYPKLQLLRSVFLLAATTFFFFGITLIGLAESTAIMDLSPVLISLGAALLLGERFGKRRATGVLASLAGAIIIIRPGGEVFSPYAILPLIGACCFAGYALTTRFVGRDEDAWTSLLYTALVGALVMSAIVPAYWDTPTGTTIAMMLAVGTIGAAGQMMLIRALMAAEAGAVAPFVYVGLLFAIVWGMIFFDEFPDAPTYIGGAVIVLAGIYVWRRENRSNPSDHP